MKISSSFSKGEIRFDHITYPDYVNFISLCKYVVPFQKGKLEMMKTCKMEWTSPHLALWIEDVLKISEGIINRW